MAETLRVAVAGLGSIGLRVARALDAGFAGLRLCAVAASTRESAAAKVAGFAAAPAILPLADLAGHADIVVECLPPDRFMELARPLLDQGGRTLVVVSVGALVANDGIVEAARERNVRILAPSGAVAGIDGLRAAREIGIESVRLVTRKPPRSFGETIVLDGREIATETIAAPLRLFEGSARASIRAFPKNVNVAATVSLAGIGPDTTRVELWADPTVAANTHRLVVASRAGEMTAETANLPDPGNPKSSAITAYSVLAALGRLDAALCVGS